MWPAWWFGGSTGLLGFPCRAQPSREVAESKRPCAEDFGPPAGSAPPPQHQRALPVGSRPTPCFEGVGWGGGARSSSAVPCYEACADDGDCARNGLASAERRILALIGAICLPRCASWASSASGCWLRTSLLWVINCGAAGSPRRKRGRRSRARSCARASSSTRPLHSGWARGLASVLSHPPALVAPLPACCAALGAFVHGPRSAARPLALRVRAFAVRTRGPPSPPPGLAPRGQVAPVLA